MAKRAKVFENLLVQTAKGGWFVYDKINSMVGDNPSFTPKWSDKPLLKSYQKEKPPLGWPRTTDSLCPKCIPEIRQQIVDGKLPHEILLNEKVGEIKAQIIERDGKILMVKDCPIHGHFEDVMSIDPPMFKHLEEVFPGRDIRAHNDARLHNHGTSTVTHGRGSVLTIDGVVRAPSSFGMTLGSPPSRTATHELVVPRSMPIIFAIVALPAFGRIPDVFKMHD